MIKWVEESVVSLWTYGNRGRLIFTAWIMIVRGLSFITSPYQTSPVAIWATIILRYSLPFVPLGLRLCSMISYLF